MPLKSTEKTLRKCMRKIVRKKMLKNISVTEICEMAEIGKRTFYHYYKDKYALFEDTYIKEFYEKLDITDDVGIYETYLRIAHQMIEEKEVFSHAIISREQNGFWDILCNLLVQTTAARFTSDSFIDEAKEFYIRKDIEITLHYFDQWIRSGFKQSPEEMVEYLRICNAIHGKWQYQISTGRTPDSFSMDKIEKNEW